MTDSIIDRATRALAKSQCGVDDLDGLDEEMQAKLREDVRAVLQSGWRELGAEPDPAVAPWDGQPVLIAAFRDLGGRHPYQEAGQPIVARWLPTSKPKDAECKWLTPYTRLRSEGMFSPTHWHPLPEPLA